MKSDPAPSVLSRAKRILRPLPSFRFFDSEILEPPAGLPLADGETLIGIYMNDLSSLKNAVIVTSFSLILESNGSWMPIPYSSISSVISPQRKEGLRHLDLALTNGATIGVPVSGGSQRTSDALEILRFLDRVLADRRAIIK